MVMAKRPAHASCHCSPTQCYSRRALWCNLSSPKLYHQMLKEVYVQGCRGKFYIFFFFLSCPNFINTSFSIYFSLVSIFHNLNTLIHVWLHWMLVVAVKDYEHEEYCGFRTPLGWDDVLAQYSVKWW